MAGLCIAILLLISMVLIAEAEVAAGNTNAEEMVNESGSESVPGGLPKGSRKPASGCHRPGYPVPPHSDCPAPPQRHRTRPILNA